jgi:hypothetical protein
MSPRFLTAIVDVKPRFARSANVERDLDGSAIQSYMPTARALDVVGRLAAGLTEPHQGRSISVRK